MPASWRLVVTKSPIPPLSWAARLSPNLQSKPAQKSTNPCSGVGSNTLENEGELRKLKPYRTREMTQKSDLFKGQPKRKLIPPNRHGKSSLTRKGKRVVKPSKVTKEMDVDREVSKFINYCNEVKAATVANKEGGQLSIVKTPAESANATKKESTNAAKK